MLIENEEILCQIQDPESDEYYDDLDFDEEKSLMFDSYNILDCIGPEFISSSEFFTNYNLGIEEIKKTDPINQRSFCEKILDLIFNKFNFKFIKNPMLSTQDDFNSIYNFIYFIHYSFIEYIPFILESLDIKLLKENVIDLNFLKNNSELIFSGIEKIIKMFKNNTDILIIQYLRYDNESILEVISKHIENDKALILTHLNRSTT